MKLFRILALFLILFFSCESVFAFCDIPSVMMDDIRASNEDHKVFCKNLKLYSQFLEVQSQFSCESRFVEPVYTSTPRKNLRLIVTSIYFNWLKNESLMDLQKEEITDAKKFLDEQKASCNQKGIKEALEAYAQAQVDYLEYKKAAQMCQKQLQIFGAKEMSRCNLVETFDVEKVIDITAKPNLDESDSNLVEHIQYEYLKIKNLKKRIQNQSQSAFPKDSLSYVQARYDFIELKKDLVLSQLRFIVYYYSLKESLY